MKQASNNMGFSLIELVTVIVILGILLPVLLQPFITSAKGVGNASGAALLSSLARESLSRELALIDSNLPISWPAADGQGRYTKSSAVRAVDGKRYSSMVAGQFVDSDFNNTDGARGTNDRYLVVTVTTTETATGKTKTLSTLKSWSYSVNR